MTILSRLNGIAARIAIAIVLAVILIVMMTIGLSLAYDNSFESRPGGHHFIFGPGGIGVVNPRQNPGMLAGKIAVIVRALAASAVPARRGIVAAIAEPEMEVVLEAPPLLEAKACLDGHLNLLRQFVQMQLEELSAAILVRACRPPGMAISLLAVETPDLGQRTKQGLRLSCRMVSGRPSSFPIIRYSPDIDRCCCCSRFSSSRSWLHFGPHAGLRVRSGSLRAARNGSASI